MRRKNRKSTKNRKNNINSAKAGSQPSYKRSRDVFGMIIWYCAVDFASQISIEWIKLHINTRSAAILNFVQNLAEGSDPQDAPGSQIDHHSMLFICANFGKSMTKCSILMQKSPTNTAGSHAAIHCNTFSIVKCGEHASLHYFLTKMWIHFWLHFLLYACLDDDCDFSVDLGNVHRTSARYSGMWISWRIVPSSCTR